MIRLLGILTNARPPCNVGLNRERNTPPAEIEKDMGYETDAKDQVVQTSPIGDTTVYLCYRLRFAHCDWNESLDANAG